MPIQVTCVECHTRFNVSEKFAGQKGPCPKCKTVITIPAKADEVVIHAPVVGPTDGKGRQILKPIKRRESNYSRLQILAMAGAIVAFLIAALVAQFAIEDKIEMPLWMMIVPMALVAPMVAYSGYNILRDQELQPFMGRELLVRVLVCGAIYALLWGGMPLASYAFGDRYDTGSWILALTGMLGAGGAVGMLIFDFDYTMGVIHYGLFLGLCLLGRVIAGIGVFPGMLEKPSASGSRATSFLWDAKPWQCVNEIASAVTVMFCG